MKIYLAGAIRGNPNFQIQFNTAAGILRCLGHTVFNPLDKDKEMFGEKALEACNESQFATNVNMTEQELRRTVFLADTSWICKEAEAIALLPGWTTSKGANAEKALGEALGLEIMYL